MTIPFRRLRPVLAAAVISLAIPVTHAQTGAVKTNLLGWASTTPNIGVEFAAGDRNTIQVSGALNPWTFSGGKRVRIWAVQPEYRRWLCEKFNGHFFGVHLLGGEYNVRNVTLPFGLLPATKEGRHYEGWYIGAGITYGYQWMLSKHWNLEASIGVGYAYSPYRLYGNCARVLDKDHRNYVGPTKAALSLMYMF